jgi:hypothetical protein
MLSSNLIRKNSTFYSASISGSATNNNYRAVSDSATANNYSAVPSPSLYNAVPITKKTTSSNNPGKPYKAIPVTHTKSNTRNYTKKLNNNLNNINKTNELLINKKKNKVSSRIIRSKTNFIKLTDDNKCVLNNDELSSIEIISKGGSTGSGAIVYLVKEKIFPYKNYIIKQPRTQPPLDYIDNIPEEGFIMNIKSEANIYNSIMTTLVENYITPYVIMGQGMINCMKQDKKIFLINETGSSINTQEILSLRKFLINYASRLNKLIILHILFQIVYTLVCFNKIKFQHKDLHLDNVLVFIRPKSIFKLTSEYYNFKYDTNETDYFNLYDIGIDIRIYDFDRSYKLPVNTMYKSLNSEIHPYKRDTTDYTKYVSNLDLFTIILNIFRDLLKIFMKDKEQYSNLLDCLFILQNYLNYKIINEKIGTVEDTNAILSFEQFKKFYTNYNTDKLSKNNLRKKHSKNTNSSGISTSSSVSNSSGISNIEIIKQRLYLFDYSKYKDKNTGEDIFVYDSRRNFFDIEYNTYFKPGIDYLLEIMTLLKEEYHKKSIILNTVPIDSFDLTKLNEVITNSTKSTKSNNSAHNVLGLQRSPFGST